MTLFQSHQSNKNPEKHTFSRQVSASSLKIISKYHFRHFALALEQFQLTLDSQAPKFSSLCQSFRDNQNIPNDLH